MTFERGGLVFNLLDTPGHEDFSEDTYRTLTAVDAAVMVLDGAKGIESQTRKLFEVCRMRDIPIITFINKMDREARDPFELIDEIEQTLALDAAPVAWPVGRASRIRRHLGPARQALPARRCRRCRRHPARRHRRPAARRPGRRRARPGAARGGHAGRGRAEGLRPRGLPRGPHDPGLLRQRAARFRRRPPAGRAGPLRPAARPPRRRPARPCSPARTS